MHNFKRVRSEKAAVFNPEALCTLLLSATYMVIANWKVAHVAERQNRGCVLIHGAEGNQ